MKYGRVVPLLGLLIAGSRAPAQAQRDSVRVRPASTFEVSVRQISQQLVAQREVEQQLRQVYEQLRLKMNEANDQPQRVASEQAAVAMQHKIEEIRSQQSMLRKRLETVCAGEERPQGYIGIVANGEFSISRVGDGPQVFNYSRHPVVVSVEPGSPAEKAGVRSHDVILAIAGRDLRAEDMIPAEVLRPGMRVMLKLQRNGEPRTVAVHVQPRPESFDLQPCPFLDASIATAFMPSPNDFVYVTTSDSTGDEPARVVLRATAPPRARLPRLAPPAVASTETLVPSALPIGAFAGGGFAIGTSVLAGLQLVPMNHDLGDTFGVEQGLLVLNVLPGTPAQVSGLKGGDVLLTANDQDLTSPRVLQRVMSLSSEHDVKLVIFRKKQRQAVLLSW